jgi:hypothetical protein
MRLLVILAAAVLVFTGCQRTSPGAAQWDAADAGRPLVADDANQVLLDPSQLSEIVGARLQLEADLGRPLPGISPAPECSPLDSVGTQAFVGDDWSGFHVLLFSDFLHNHVAAEAVAAYPDKQSAATVFASATKDVAACDTKEAIGATGLGDWRFAVNDVTADAVRWNKQQLDSPEFWVCYGQARVRNNVIVQAMSCQGDDGGELNAQTMLDQMSANVWDLSARR